MGQWVGVLVEPVMSLKMVVIRQRYLCLPPPYPSVKLDPSAMAHRKTALNSSKYQNADICLPYAETVPVSSSAGKSSKAELTV